MNNIQNESHEEPDLYETRLAKLKDLLNSGINPYVNSFHRKHLSAELLAIKEDQFSEEFIIAGRIRSKRIMGKAGFMDLEDETGRIQIYGASKELSGENYEIFKHLDLGDIIGVRGTLFNTKTGQRTVRLNEFLLLAKCIRPLPVVKEAEGKVFDAFSDKEQRYRMRYVDMIVNSDVRENFIIRSKIISEIRAFLTERGFLEVETPMMHTIPGGAAAKPFQTHHNAMDMELYLRIAPELYLKRLLVGGMPKVFELNRNFRNEGISYKHNPEFTMLELYEAYGDMKSMMEICETMMHHLVMKIHKTDEIPYEDKSIKLAAPWARLTYFGAIEKFTGVKFDPSMDLNTAKDHAKKIKVDKEVLNKCMTFWDVVETVFDEKVESELVQPTFITEYPRSISPLAKSMPENPDFTERFEVFVAGREVANAFSELNDPFDQKKRFEEQVRLRETGEGEGGYMDLDYIRALEYGMPPAGGMGIGIDRIAMLLTNSHTIKDTILFPLMRPEEL
ncbi:MAG: lysine--tRNA ligase [Spirochaetia bacterium]|nr:lysine--tRNA ligase [Spirochaetia bacterium]